MKVAEGMMLIDWSMFIVITVDIVFVGCPGSGDYNSDHSGYGSEGFIRGTSPFPLQTAAPGMC